MKHPGFKNIKFEEVECLFCKSKTEKEFLFRAPDRLNNLPGIFSLVRCKRCGLVFQNPRPKEKFIKHYYPDQAGYFQPSEKKRSKFYSWMERSVLINFYGYRNTKRSNFFTKFFLFPIYFYFFRHQAIPKYVKDGKLLEIGCSYGTKLEKLKKYGWQVFGIELNEKAARYAREKKNLNVKTGSIFDFNFSENSFDVIIMDMVLEHLYQPNKIIKKITSWLKPNGQLIFSIPYFEGFEFTIFKEYAYGVQLPCHIYFFNKNQIKKLLNAHYQNIKFIFHHFDRDVVASAHYKYQKTKNIFWKFVAYNKLLRFSIIKPLVFLLSLFNKTSRVTVYAQKNN